MMQTQINYESLCELLKQLGPIELLPLGAQPLVSAAQEMAVLLGQIASAHDPADQEVLKNALDKNGQRIIAEFQEYCARFGTTPEEWISYANNPDHFSLQEWDTLQRAQNRAKQIFIQSPEQAPRKARSRLRRLRPSRNI